MNIVTPNMQPRFVFAASVLFQKSWQNEFKHEKHQLYRNLPTNHLLIVQVYCFFQRNFKADGYKQVEITSKILGGQVDQSSRQVARVSFFSKDFHNRRCVYRILEAILHLRRFLSLTINSKLCKVREKGRRG